MKITTQIPEKEYPYLAVWAGKEEHLTIEQIARIKTKDIVLISMVESDEECDKKPYVQWVLGGKEGHITKCEDEYFPLPKGYLLCLCQ